MSSARMTPLKRYSSRRRTARFASPLLRKRLIARLASERSGATAVEFAIVSPVLLLFMFGIVEFGLAFAADITLRNATQSAARTGRTGFVAENATQDATVRAIIRRRAGVLMDPDKLTITSISYSGFDTLKKPEPFEDKNGNGKRDSGESYTDVNGNGKWDADQGRTGYGGTNEVVLYTVTYPWKFVTPLIGKLVGKDGELTLSATAVVQNEPY